MARSSTTMKPGQTLNPNGRPKREWTVAGLIEEALEEQDIDGVPYKKKVTEKLRQLALRGDMNAIKEVHQRLDGMPVQKNEYGGEDGGPIKIDLTVLLKKAYGQRNTITPGEVLEDGE